jgi:hypothetical protein
VQRWDHFSFIDCHSVCKQCLEQLNSGGTCFPCHPEWVVAFLSVCFLQYNIMLWNHSASPYFCNYVHKIMLQVLWMFLHLLNPHVICCFSLSHLLSELCNLVVGRSAWGTCDLHGVPWLFSCMGSGVIPGFSAKTEYSSYAWPRINCSTHTTKSAYR